MKKIAWITDSISCISPSEAEEIGVFVVPCTIIIDGKVYRDGVDITPEQFYEKFDGANTPPTTSQPAIGEFSELYENLKADYEIGIAVHASSKVSGTINGSSMGAEIADFPILTVDSKTGIGGIRSLILKGKELEQQGYSPDKIVEELQEIANASTGLILCGSLEQLKRSGRLSNTSYFVGTILNVKPLLRFVDGTLTPYDKVRGMKKAENKLIETFDDSFQRNPNISDLNIIHSCSEEKALEWLHFFKSKYPTLNITINTLSPAIGAHAGKNTIGILWFEKTLLFNK